MRKLLLLLTLSFMTISSFAVPKWLGDIFSCSYRAGAWEQAGMSGDFCKWERKLVSTSWLWHCDDIYQETSQPCNLDPNLMPIPIPEEYQGIAYGTIASNMSELALLNYPVEPEWMDAEELENNPAVLEAALTFRLTLAGYDVDPAWFDLTSDPCPVPAPTLTIQVPAAQRYINLECDDDVILYPNPNTGNFNVQIAYYEDVTELEVIRNSDQYVAYSKNTALNSTEPVTFTPVAGTYTLRLHTPVGIYTKQFIVELPPTVH
jgi:hypothetical protein